jgi:diguanylate cyclase (GGDEF)-like protein
MVVALSEAEVLSNWQADSALAALVVCILLLVINGLGAYLGLQVRKGERLENELAGLAFRDGLTGLANRRSFDETFDREWRRTARDGAAISVLMMDVDWFKSFNDTYGHQRGDDVLRTIAECAKKAVNRPGDLVARYGGEEFVVLLPATEAPVAFAMADRIRRAVDALQIVNVGNASGKVTISIGVASVFAGRDDRPSTLMSAADAALYAAKNSGRNRTAASGVPVDSFET